MKTKSVNKSEILEIAEQMKASHFLLEFEQLLTYHDIDNLSDADEGFVNVSIEVKDGRKKDTLYLLFCDGKFDSYSY